MRKNNINTSYELFHTPCGREDLGEWVFVVFLWNLTSIIYSKSIKLNTNNKEI